MTLLQSPQKRFVFAMVIFMFIGGTSYAKTYTLNGRVPDSQGDKVKGATLSLFSDGDLISEQETSGNGKFKFKKIDISDFKKLFETFRNSFLKKLTVWQVEYEIWNSQSCKYIIS